MAMGRLVVPLEGFMGPRGVRGYSYGERQEDGQLHTGADLNIGAGDEDAGVPVLSLSDGVVEAVMRWDGRTYGFGNAVGVRHELPGGISLWGVYGHCDEVGVEAGYRVSAGEQLATVGRSGNQQWAHLHLELRWRSFDETWLGFWGGGLPVASLSRLYADPYTVFRLVPGWNALAGAVGAAAWVDGGGVAALAALQSDREYNFSLKMVFEGTLRELERRRRLKRGTVEGLIAGVGT